MDLKKTENKDELLKRKEALFKDFDVFLSELINNDTTYKNGALIYYWLNDYKNYLKNEKAFDCKYLPAYQRGNIVNINLGYNLGSEMGGLHYAVVLADSSINNPNLVILPIKSIKSNSALSLHKSQINLGNDLYNRLVGKHAALKISIGSELDSLVTEQKKIADDMKKVDFTKVTKDVVAPLFNSFQERGKVVDDRIELLRKKLASFQSIALKISKIKLGSIAEMSQIRTVSKMRIKDPLDRYDVLYGIKMSPSNMAAIDNAIIHLYTMTKKNS